ncbi:3-phosphoshikimate 1-carboxyvinyltransferase [Marinifilum sp. N1E240]|uniref:3-phosphoshikimate 1-carboxyvinyltransferase n=1 Tax=Marinifilum sp. N1E240 TaxID=2608082 RepID=UPI00128E1F91|nr:3-phosphoshikimate 1-carboxyvinyltransferase [Marinifilum sp. N1E240]MPQ48248.1 3-phosphoshikimate 1-carboxyvinyltransferase [Marinifilum sp. N1E240]
MRVRIQSSKINGNLTPPSSKSMMQRALAAAALSKGTTIIHNPCKCEDADAATGIIKKMGAEVIKENNTIRINNKQSSSPSKVMVGESGLSLRMFSPILALNPEPVEITGRGSILKRPVHNILEGLESLGIEFENPGKGLLPFSLKGGYKETTAIIDGSLGSQFLTGLLMALPCRKEDTILEVKNLKSIPYINMTIDLLKEFGIKIEHEEYKTFRIKGNQEYKADEYTIEADWSSAAPLLVAGALKGKVTLNHLNRYSYQADIAILDALKKCGASIHWEKDSLTVQKKGLNSFEFDATHCPDLFPPLVALAVHCNGDSRIKGVHRLEHKESNRGIVLQKEFGKIGVPIRIEGDEMIIPGGRVRGGLTNSNNDHRIAMALAVAAVGSEYPVEIGQHDCVAKSYPDFFSDLRKLGAGIAEFYFKSQFV